VCVLVFGSQPPISIAAPLPIHSRQRLPFAGMVPPPVAPQVGCCLCQLDFSCMMSVHNTMYALAVCTVLDQLSGYTVCLQIKSDLFAINSIHNITKSSHCVLLDRQTGDNFALMSAYSCLHF